MMNRLTTTTPFTLLPAVVVLTQLLAPPASGQWSEGPKIHANDGTDNDFFGGAVAVSGDVAIVGAEQSDTAGETAGAAYVYRRSGNGWSQEQKLMASDAAAGDAFGNSVAVSGDVALVASSLNGELGAGAGAVYVFRRTGNEWEEEVKLTANDGAAGDRFGISVAVSGSTILVGAYTEDANGSNSGSAYVFRHNGSSWQQHVKLTPTDPAANAFFGFSVALDEDVAVIGATGDNDNGLDAGAAYIFRKAGSTWSQQDKLLANDGDYFDGFGFSVDVSGDLAIVGAFADVVGGAYTGSAYIFRFNSVNDWAQEIKLLAYDRGHGDLFGQTVAVNGDVALVGADREDDNGTDSGAAYIYRYRGTGWTHQTKLMASDGAPNDNFGRAVALSGKTAIVGAWKDDDMGSQAGAAYFVDGLAMIGESSVDRFGRTMVNIGDVDGDGTDDLVVGTPYNDEQASNAGKVYLYSGATSSVIRGHLGEAAKDRFGDAVASAGDVDNDGTPDYVVGAPFHAGKAGAVYVYSGANGAQLLKMTGTPAERLGWSVAGGLDANGDGRDDILAGAPYNGDGGAKAGKAYLFSGFTGSTLVEFTGEAAKDRLGWAVAVLGLANADSIPDLAISAPWNDDAAGNAGKVYVHSSAGYGLLYSLIGANAGDQFGRSLAVAGRVDGDDRNDIVIGSPYYDKNDLANAGRIDVHSGLDGQRIWKRVGQAAGDRLGWTTRSAGDVNGDGSDDIVATSPWNDHAGTNRGRIYVRSGATGGVLTMYDGDANGDLCGYAVAGAGDLDGNGLDDLWIGAPHNDVGGSNAGRVYRELSSASAATAPSNPDVNGDDVIDAGDLLAMLMDLGLCDDCETDLDDNGTVDLADVLSVIRDWD